jgi:hypothetical protein
MRQTADVWKTAQIADRINHDGFAVVENFVKYDDLKTAQKFVKDAVAANGGNCLHIDGHENLSGTFLYDLPKDPEFVKLCKGIFESGTGKPAPDTEFYQILRCLSGDLVQKHSMVFHYDSYILTALIPILIPTEGKPGDLIVLPNTRPLRKTYLHNLFDKMMLDNKYTQKRLKSLWERGSKRITKIKMVPGNLYFFWGYRSIHTNEAVDPHNIRSTALLHLGNPHQGSKLRTMLGR